ncbi:proton channel OTOP3-like [Lepisosteus oculatus]|uniref:Otopetrin 3 n=1 Tax=Lepisosteus oculatus TaxID=7918 RepID=W5N678_LEPOC|nr:PREDICTED: otopetrin-3-like [Lepisosteus oculatus]
MSGAQRWTEEPDSPGLGLTLGQAGEEMDPVLIWAPSGRRLVSGLLALNLVLLGAALLTAEVFNPEGLKHQEPRLFILVLMALSLAWMLWYLLWARRQPGISPHRDHHAGGICVTVVLMVFSACSLLLHVFKMGYYIIMAECKPAAKVLLPFFEAPFLGLQTYLLWGHSRDCIHKHKILTRSGLVLTLTTDLLLWLSAVTEDTVHLEIELEKEERAVFPHASLPGSFDDSNIGMGNVSQCHCGAHAGCRIFRKGYEVLYPFNIEYYLMAACLLYIMWKNVGRHMEPHSHPEHAQKVTLRVVYHGGVLFGPLVGAVVLLVGIAIFIMYQVWVSSAHGRFTAFVLFYSYHLAVIPVMSFCSLAGVIIHKIEARAQDMGHNPTRSLDVILLLGTALGQLSICYFSVVAAWGMGPSGILGGLDLSYSLLSLLELILQNIFIIEGLHRHPDITQRQSRRKIREFNSFFKKGIKPKDTTKEVTDPPVPLVEKSEVRTATVAPVEKEPHSRNHWSRRVLQEICAFLILANIMLWVIPAFGAHPQFENGLGKQFFGFSAWFVIVNLGQPLGVFYRMHSVGALLEVLVTA